MTTAPADPQPMTIRPPRNLRSELPLVELERAKVTSPRRRVRIRRGSKARAAADCSFGAFTDDLRFDAWSLFHAAKKTELTTTFTQADVNRRALPFSAEYRDFFIWNTNNLRRVDRSVFDLEEFSSSSLAGRFGEAVAYLVMVKRGYAYWDRIATLWERAVSKANISHPEMTRAARVISKATKSARPDKEPDFAFETASKDVALMESKGSFVHPARDAPTVKSDLSKALKQLAAWSRFVTPTPSKSFAIGTYFRDASDSNGDPSLVAIVDPPNVPESGAATVEFQRDWIRRGNYGAWLIGMGLVESGRALREGRAVETGERMLPVVSVAGREFAIVFERVILKENGRGRRGHSVPPWWWLPIEWSLPGPWWQAMLADMGAHGVEVVGLDSRILRRVGEALGDAASPALLHIQGDDWSGVRESFDGPNGFDGSVMPDGSMVGIITPRQMETIREEAFGL